MSNAIAVLDAVKRARCQDELMGSVFGRISFFVNAGVRFIEEHAKLRAMAGCGTSSDASATASRTRSTAACATACRSTRSA